MIITNEGTFGYFIFISIYKNYIYVTNLNFITTLKIMKMKI